MNFASLVNSNTQNIYVTVFGTLIHPHLGFYVLMTGAVAGDAWRRTDDLESFREHFCPLAQSEPTFKRV